MGRCEHENVKLRKATIRHCERAKTARRCDHANLRNSEHETPRSGPLRQVYGKEMVVTGEAAERQPLASQRKSPSCAKSCRGAHVLGAVQLLFTPGAHGPPRVPLTQFLCGVKTGTLPPSRQVLASPGPIQMYCCDGSGLHGTGDWCFPPPGAVYKFGSLRRSLLTATIERSLPQRIVAHSAMAAESPLLTDTETNMFRYLVADFCKASKMSSRVDVAPGQPFCLDLLESLRRVGGFCDPTLGDSLRNGVSTGVLEKLAPSGRWPSSNSVPCLGPSLEWKEGNWKSASADESA